MGALSAPKKWDRMFGNEKIMSRDAKVRLIEFQIIHLFCWTPSRLSRLGLRLMPECWCCKSEEGHLLHVLWSGNKVQEFQARNYNNICEVLETQHLLSPSLFVRGDSSKLLTGDNIKLAKEDRRCSLNSGSCCFRVARVAALGKKKVL